MTLTLSIGVGLLVGAILFRIFFQSLSDFLGCLRDYFYPAPLSLIRGMNGEDFWGELRLMVYMSAIAGSGFVAHYTLVRL